MIAWEEFVYVFVCGAMLMVSVLGLESAAVTPSLDRWDKRFFVIFFSALAVCPAAFFLELSVYVNPALLSLLVVAYYVQSLSGAIAFPLLAVYLLHCCGEDWRNSVLFRGIVAVWVSYVILISIAPFTTIFYCFGPDNRLIFGPAYKLLIAPILMMQLVDATGVARRRDKLSRQYYRAFLVCLIPVTVVVIVHMFIIPVFTLIDISLTLSAYSAYRLILSYSIEQSLRQQREIASQRASIAVLQMRPHFICNTMTSIYYLCDQDPKLAKQVTMDFTTYLRQNFAAIARGNAIPFSEELEHARAYLAVEQAQFEDNLLVDYDTQHTRFRVPPLTLQPLVENAVKHGMDPDFGPLHIWVRTRETNTCSMVFVEDDGPGFDPAVADDPHSTLANIRQRLDMMGSGRLDIMSRDGGGTVVRLTIPKRE
ncbi:MAG: histidine kinase [Coriobacteriales bacterium]|nr:histidine kinase [Coriobacteriales bacterium]